MPETGLNWRQAGKRVGKWLLFSVLFALIPLAFVWLSGLLRGADRDLAVIIGKGELFLVIIALSGAAIGDLMMSSRPKAIAKLLGGGFTLLVLLMSAFLYVDIFNAVSTGSQLDSGWIVNISAALFGLSLLSNGCCIAVAE